MISVIFLQIFFRVYWIVCMRTKLAQHPILENQFYNDVSVSIDFQSIELLPNSTEKAGKDADIAFPRILAQRINQVCVALANAKLFVN